MNGRGDRWALEHRSARSAVYTNRETGVTVEITPRYDHVTHGGTHMLADPTRFCVELIPDWFDSLPAGLTDRVAYAPTFVDAERVARQFMRSYDRWRG